MSVVGFSGIADEFNFETPSPSEYRPPAKVEPKINEPAPTKPAVPVLLPSAQIQKPAKAGEEKRQAEPLLGFSLSAQNEHNFEVREPSKPATKPAVPSKHEPVATDKPKAPPILPSAQIETAKPAAKEMRAVEPVLGFSLSAQNEHNFEVREPDPVAPVAPKPVAPSDVAPPTAPAVLPSAKLKASQGNNKPAAPVGPALSFSISESSEFNFLERASEDEAFKLARAVAESGTAAVTEPAKTKPEVPLILPSAQLNVQLKKREAPKPRAEQLRAVEPVLGFSLSAQIEPNVDIKVAD
jgi:hypothetical protein